MEQRSKQLTILAAASLSSFLTAFMGSSVVIALPSIAMYFSMDAVLINWVSTSYLIATAIFLLPLGRAADLLGRKRIFTTGIGVFTVMTLLAPFAPDKWIFLALRALQGIGGAMIFSTGIAMLTAVYPQQDRGRVLGINVATVYGGLTMGPVVGGFLASRCGWQSIFLVCVVLGIFVYTLVSLNVGKDPRSEHPARMDVAGSIIYCIFMVSLMLGFSWLPGPYGWLGLATGVLFFSVFIRFEISCASPVLDITLLTRNRAFAFSNAAALIHYGATFSTGFLISLYLQYVRGMSPEHAGLVMVIQPAVMSVLSPFAGILSDRIEPRLLASSGMAITASGLFSLSFIGPDTSITFIIVVLAYLGSGFAMFSSPNTNAVMSSVDSHDYGVASGILSTMRVTGQAFSMGLTLMLFSIIIGRVRITPEVLPAFMTACRTGLTLFALLCIPGIAASLARGDLRNRHQV